MGPAEILKFWRISDNSLFRVFAKYFFVRKRGLRAFKKVWHALFWWPEPGDIHGWIFWFLRKPAKVDFVTLFWWITSLKPVFLIKPYSADGRPPIFYFGFRFVCVKAIFKQEGFSKFNPPPLITNLFSYGVPNTVGCLPFCEYCWVCEYCWAVVVGDNRVLNSSIRSQWVKVS